MAILLSVQERINRNRRTRKGQRTGQGVKSSRSEAAQYNRELQQIVDAMITETNNVLPQLLIKLQPEYSNDSANFLLDVYAEELNGAIRAMASQARDITPLAEALASQWASDVNSDQRNRFYKAVERSIGVNLNGIIQEDGINDIVQSKIAENVGLIQSLPDEYYKKIVTIVNEQTTRGDNARSIIAELQKVGVSTKKRARLIARDQTQKLNAAVTQARQESLGIEEYEWQTSEDERVRASHRSKNGKRFRWDNPPKDTGHPGQDINCRCVALPIINLDNVRR